jgi:hypothetical protein
MIQRRRLDGSAARISSYYHRCCAEKLATGAVNYIKTPLMGTANIQGVSAEVCRPAGQPLTGVPNCQKTLPTDKAYAKRQNCRGVDMNANGLG